MDVVREDMELFGVRDEDGEDEMGEGGGGLIGSRDQA